MNINNILKKNSARISLGMLLSILVTESAWSAEVTSNATETVIGRKPTMSPGAIQSSTAVIGIGTVLSMTPDGSKWIFQDADGDTESGTLYVWKEDGTDVVLSSGVTPASKSYTITEKDLGKVIRLYVTPKTDPLKTAPFEGDTVMSTNTLTTINANTVTKVTIEGYTVNPQVGNKLTAKLACSGNNGSGCGNETDYNYQWKIEGRVASTGLGDNMYGDISGATSSTYTPTSDQQKLKIKVVVKNKPAAAPAAEAAVAAATAKAKAKVTQ